MKRLIFLLLIIVIFSCESNNEEKRFYRTYRQILIVRAETEDSLLANAKVQKIFQKNGYTEQEFRKTFFSLAQKEKDFIRIIDSLRNSVKNEYKKIIDSTKIKKKQIEE